MEFETFKKINKVLRDNVHFLMFIPMFTHYYDIPL
jgi:hypothetical protein